MKESRTKTWKRHRGSDLLKLLLCSGWLCLLAACSSDSESEEKLLPPVISGLEEVYSLSVGEELTLSPQVEHVTPGTGEVYSWTVNGEARGDRPSFTFREVKPQTYQVVFKVTTAAGSAAKELSMVVAPLDALKLQASTYQLVPIDVAGSFPSLKKGQGWMGKSQASASQNSPTETESPSLEWKLVKADSDLYRLSTTPALGAAGATAFVAARAGKYHFQAVCDGVAKDVIIEVADTPKKLSPYIAQVYDYLPAPGQFVNELPKYEPGDTHEDMVRKAGEWLVGEEASMITLGGWGGYVVFGFDHMLVNVEGKRDFRVNGNAFGAADNGRPNAPFGGSCEPGIVQVAYDANGNGQPDDTWYEIAGSSSFSAEKEPWYAFAVENKNHVEVIRDYQLTYYRPVKEKPEMSAEPDNPLAYVSIKDYIRWKDNQQQEGYKVKNVYHSQSYYPQWVSKDELSFEGVRLPDNGINEGKYNPGINAGNVYFVLYGFRYGYVDNAPNLDDNSGIDIDWAIDKEGRKVHLPGIHFVRVYNGVNQENGWLGECSTEVERAEDLHMLGKRIDTIK